MERININKDLTQLSKDVHIIFAPFVVRLLFGRSTRLFHILLPHVLRSR